MFQEDGTANKGLEVKKYRKGLDNRQIVQFLVGYLVERECCHGIDSDKQGEPRPWTAQSLRPRAGSGQHDSAKPSTGTLEEVT